MSADKYLIGHLGEVQSLDFSNDIAWNDHKIAFLSNYTRGKSVLDLGCVMHNPKSYRSRYWVHKAIKEIASDLVGIDLYQEGITFLQKKGFNVIHGDACNFDLGRKFDVIIAGDLIEHLDNFSGFLESCKRHMHEQNRLLISTPNPWFWKNIVKACLYKEVPNNAEHTCWLCPRTLRQLVRRYGMDIGEIIFGSRYRLDRFMPLPRGIKHTSFHAEIYLEPPK